MKKFRKFVGWMLTICLVFAIAVIVARVLMQADESVLDRLTVSDALAEAYRENESLPILTHSVPYQISEKDGYFSAYDFVWIPDLAEIQIVVRYNNFVFDDIGVADGHEFTFALRVGDSDEVVYPVQVETDAKWMYQYRRLVFRGVVPNDRDDLWIELLTEPETEAVNRLVCHYAHQQTDNSSKLYKLSRSEKKALLGQN